MHHGVSSAELVQLAYHRAKGFFDALRRENDRNFRRARKERRERIRDSRERHSDPLNIEFILSDRINDFFAKKVSLVCAALGAYYVTKKFAMFALGPPDLDLSKDFQMQVEEVNTSIAAQIDHEAQSLVNEFKSGSMEREDFIRQGYEKGFIFHRNLNQWSISDAKMRELRTKFNGHEHQGNCRAYIVFRQVTQHQPNAQRFEAVAVPACVHN